MSTPTHSPRTQLLTRKEVARLLSCCTRTVTRREAAGELTPIRLSARMIRYRISEVEALIAQAEGQATTPEPNFNSSN